MSGNRTNLALAAICLVVMLLSGIGFVWALATGLALSLDGLLLILVCLLMGGIFALMLVLLAKEAGWLGSLMFLRKKSAAKEAPAAHPAKPAGGQGN